MMHVLAFFSLAYSLAASSLAATHVDVAYDDTHACSTLDIWLPVDAEAAP